MTTLYLVRHALKEKRIGDAAITTEGLQQAELTATYFKQVPLHHIISSPLKRARQTSERIAEASQLPVREEYRLRERANWGDTPGQSFEEFVDLWNRCTKERDFIPPSGDSARMAGERLSSCLLEISTRDPEASVLVVTHGGLITDFMVNTFSPEALDLVHPQFIEKQHQLVPECSITTLRCDKDNGFTMINFANTAHLVPFAQP